VRAAIGSSEFLEPFSLQQKAVAPLNLPLFDGVSSRV